MVDEALVGSENPRKSRRECHEEGPEEGGDRDTHEKEITESLFDPLGVFGAVVIRDDRLGALA